MLTLYEIGQVYQNIMDLIIEGADEEALIQALEHIDDELEDKADAYITVIKKIEADIEMIRKEEKRLAEKRRSMDNSIKRMKENLESHMILMDKKKFKTDKFSFNIQRNRPSLKIASEENIPEKFYRVEKKLNRRELLEEIQEGSEIDGVEVTQTESLRVR